MNKTLKKRINNVPYRITRIGNGANDAYHEGVKYGAEWMLNHQWISVDEALPEAGEEVLLFNKNYIRHYEIGWLRKEKEYSKSKWAITNGFVEDDDITHWMPIPKFTN